LTLYAAASDVLGPTGLILAAVLVIIGIAICLRTPARSDASLALWSCLSIAMARYAWSYDLLLLVPPVVLTAGVVARHESGGRRSSSSCSVSRSSWPRPSSYGVALARGRETFTVTVSIVAFAFLSAVLWRERAGTDAPARGAA